MTQTVYCPEVANAVSNYNTQTVNGTSTIVPVPVGYAYDFTKCDGNLHVNQYNNTALVMGYVDLGHWGLFTPYIGAGAGVNANTMTGSLNFNQQDTGANYAGAQVTGTAPANWVVQTGMQNGYPYYSTAARARRHLREPGSRSARRTGAARSTRPNTPSPARSPPASASRSASPRRSTSPTRS